MNQYLYIILISCWILSKPLQAQQIVSVTKTEVLNKVSTQNLTGKIAKQELNQAHADFMQANSVLLPKISLSYTGITTNNPLAAFGAKLNQEILTEGDFNPAILNDPNRVENFATVIEIQQPLVNLDGIYQRKAARTKILATEYQNTRVTDHLTFEVEKAYMQLQLAYKAVDVLQKALEAALANKQIADNNFKQGYLQKSDVLNVDVRVTEVQNQLQIARSNVANASNYLSLLMNEKTDIILKPTDTLAISTSILEENITVPENRADIKAIQLTTNVYETMHKANRMNFLPRLNAFGSYQLFDNQIFQAGASGYLVGAALSWNIFEGAERIGKTQKSKAAFEKSQLLYEQYVAKSNLELNKAQRLLLDAENKIKLSKLALDQSKEALRIRTNRFKEGLEKTSDVLMSETQYAQKQLAYYQSIYDFNYAQAYLHFLTKD